MNLNEILVQLRAERDRIDQSLLALERLAQGRGIRTVKPPAQKSRRPARAPRDVDKSSAAD